jgi:hypothetical protein
VLRKNRKHLVQPAPILVLRKDRVHLARPAPILVLRMDSQVHFVRPAPILVSSASEYLGKSGTEDMSRQYRLALVNS